MEIDVQFRLRIKRGDLIVLGPGKVALLEAIAATGSISAAARALDMSYRRAWLLVDEMNRGFSSPVIDAMTGGTKGGGAVLTDMAREIIDSYRAIEEIAARSAAAPLNALLKKMET